MTVGQARAGSSTGAGATRTSSRRTTRSRQPRTGSASTSGSAPAEVERPVALEDVELRPPRIDAARRARRALLPPIRYERASHALGKAYRDVVRGFRGEFDEPPDVGRPAARGGRRRARCSTGAPLPAHAAIPFGGGTSVVRRGRGARWVERPWSRSTCARSTACSRWTRSSRAARIQAGATGPVLEEQLRAHGLTLRHFPQSFEYSTLGGWIATRAGGHFATVPTHIDDLVESVRALTPGGRWESRRLPASGAGPSPDRMLIGSEGILGVITEAWVRVQARPRFGARRGRGSRRSPTGARRCARWRSRGSRPRTAACSTRPRRELTGAAPDGRAMLVLGFESADHPLDAWLDTRARAVPATTAARRRAEARPRPDGGRRCAGRARVVARRLPARAVPARHDGGRRRAGRDVRDRDHLGPLRSRSCRRCASAPSGVARCAARGA